MSNKFCRYLSNQARIEYGQFRPCCWFRDQVPVIDADILKKRLYKINSWADADGACCECEYYENIGKPSPRIKSLSSPKFSDQDADGDIINLEIQIDKDCNGACLICGPFSSTTWEKYQAKSNYISIKDVPDSEYKTTEYFEQIKNSFSFEKLKSIRILGGEPLRNTNHLKFLELIPNPAQVVVSYTTNGSYRITNNLLKIWSEFKQVNLTYSIDAIGEQFNYLRWPLQWSQVESNLRHLVELTDSNIQLQGFSYTTTPFSLFYHDRYTDWAVEFFEGTKYHGESMFNDPSPPRSGKILLSAVPDLLADCLRNKYGDDHCITRLLVPYEAKNYQEFIGYIEHHDRNRKLQWQNIFPDVVKFFTK